MNIQYTYTRFVNTIIFIFCFIGSASAASFDCSKASSLFEKTVCDSPSISLLDEELADVYKKAKAASTDPVNLKTEQLEWIKEARRCQSDRYCIERSYNKRISELDSQLIKVRQEHQTSVMSESITASETVVSPSAHSTNAAEVELPEAPAGTAPQAQLVSEPITNDANTITRMMSNETYQRYGTIAVACMLGISTLFYLLRFFVSMKKRGASVVSEKGLELKHDVAERTLRVEEAIAEKKVEIAADIVARNDAETSVASMKPRKGLSGATEKIAAYLQILKRDLLDMKAKVLPELTDHDAPVKQKTLNIWARFSSRQRIIFSVIFVFVTFSLVILILGSSKLSGSKLSIRDMDPKDAAEILSVSAFSNCLAGQITMSGLIARGDPVNEALSIKNRELGILLKKSSPYVRQYISDPSALDTLVRNNMRAIRSGDEAAELVMGCHTAFDSAQKARQAELKDRKAKGYDKKTSDFIDGLENARKRGDGR